MFSMGDYGLIIVSLITTIGGIIMLIIHGRQVMIRIGLKMDYKRLEYENKIKLAKMKGDKELAKETLKQKQKFPSIDLGGIGDAITDLVDASDEDEGGLLSLAKPLIKGFLGRKKQQSEEEEVADEGDGLLFQ